MKWPWKSDNLEYRAAAYTDALIALLTAQADGGATNAVAIRRRGARGRQWACGAGLCYRVGGYHVQRGDAGLDSGAAGDGGPGFGAAGRVSFRD